MAAIIKVTFEACDMRSLRDIDARKVERRLTAEREREDGVSIRTANAYVQAVKQFTRWAVRAGLLGEDPLVGLGTLGNPEKDRRLERRALVTSSKGLTLLPAQAPSAAGFGATFSNAGVQGSSFVSQPFLPLNVRVQAISPAPLFLS